MLSARDLALERERMRVLRKEAALNAPDPDTIQKAVESTAKGVGSVSRGIQGLGKTLWSGAKRIGMGGPKGSLGRIGGGLGVLAGGSYLASKVPDAARQATRTKQEAMVPWQGKKVFR